MRNRLLILFSGLLFSGCVFQTALTKPNAYSRYPRQELDSLQVEFYKQESQLSKVQAERYQSMLIQLYSEPSIKAAIDSVYPFNKLSEIKP